MAEEKKRKHVAPRKLIHKYTLEIRDEDTFEKKRSFRLSRLNVIAAIGFYSLFIIAFMILIIAFSPIREYIPGYQDIGLSRRLVETSIRIDSLEHELFEKTQYIDNIRNIISGDVDPSSNNQQRYSSSGSKEISQAAYKNIKLERSEEDSLLRADIEAEDRFNLTFSDKRRGFNTSPGNVKELLLFIPLKGLITDSFSLTKKHFGIDIVGGKNEAVKATLEGTIILAAWTTETGYVIGIQHENNLISFYKHNSVLLKKEGMHVNAGEAIAVIGNSGELSTGPHLHFELWYNGIPQNPMEYMVL